VLRVLERMLGQPMTDISRVSMELSFTTQTVSRGQSAPALEGLFGAGAFQAANLEARGNKFFGLRLFQIFVLVGTQPIAFREGLEQRPENPRKRRPGRFSDGLDHDEASRPERQRGSFASVEREEPGGAA
jgi:hypothetical protein